MYGEWECGALVTARPARLVGSELQAGVLYPQFQLVSEVEHRFWPSSNTSLACPLTQRDPYEARVVAVRQSGVTAAGEGTFALVDLPPGRLVAYYNGIRLAAGERSPYEDTGYAIYVEWRGGSRAGGRGGAGEHMDLPPELHSYSAYTATTAHKLNHSFTPNCCWTNAVHPCYGLVPSVTTLEAVRSGQELTVHYSMDMVKQK